MENIQHLIFIYGTLRQHGSAHHLMCDAEFLGTGSITGRLVHVDQYPGLVPCDHGRVYGELFLVNHALLIELDRYEGCLESPPLYLREEMAISQENGEMIIAQTYVFQRLESHQERIESGDWIKWLETKSESY